VVRWVVCDTVVVVPDQGPVWFAKNSDREPSEAQFLECHEGSAAGAAPMGLPDASGNSRLLLSRPAWMWGCEMGVNEHGLAIGNEAVFTRLPVPRAGYAGMDFQRVALTTCRTADDALEQLIELTERFTQGGAMGHRHRSFRYHSSFLIADATTAWVFETVGNHWAAKRVHGVATISNALTIEDDFDRVDDGAYKLARERGWVKSSDFSFAGAFSDRAMSLLAGARVRRACTGRSLAGVREPRARDFIRALTHHGAPEPGKGLRSEAPCAHASWLPTRTSAQTTSSIIARLEASGPTVWATGTSSPCLSVFKPAPFDPELLPPHPVADARFDERELWWVHERLHRACLADYHGRRVTFAEDLERLQDDCLRPEADPSQSWRDHRASIDDWLRRTLEVKVSKNRPLTRLFWSRQSRTVSIPGTPKHRRRLVRSL
jgi:secernin